MFTWFCPTWEYKWQPQCWISSHELSFEMLDPTLRSTLRGVNWQAVGFPDHLVHTCISRTHIPTKSIGVATIVIYISLQRPVRHGSWAFFMFLISWLLRDLLVILCITPSRMDFPASNRITNIKDIYRSWDSYGLESFTAYLICF